MGPASAQVGQADAKGATILKETPDCPISGTPNALAESTPDHLEYHCPMCGTFRITRTALQLAGEGDQVVLFDALQAAKRAVEMDEVPTIANLSG